MFLIELVWPIIIQAPLFRQSNRMPGFSGQVVTMIKYVYYGFGGFIGSVCGIAINLIFYMLDQSGIKFAAYLIKTFGFMGEYILEVINALPLLGAVLGIILVKYLFGRELEEKRD